jgi:hypothetical protein
MKSLTRRAFSQIIKTDLPQEASRVAQSATKVFE